MKVDTTRARARKRRGSGGVAGARKRTEKGEAIKRNSEAARLDLVETTFAGATDRTARTEGQGWMVAGASR